MKIGLHDAEREAKLNSKYTKKRNSPKFPNLAIMKLSAYHKAQGDTVEWWNPSKNYDKVYSSKVFTFTPENPMLPENTERGGTGYGLYDKLPDVVDDCFPDYSIYPDCDYALGFLTRGCIRQCDFCLVNRKEGYINEYRKWQDVVRPDSKKLVLIDNNILACEYGLQQVDELVDTEYEIDFNQGLDARIVAADESGYIADILSRIKWLRKETTKLDKKTGKLKAVKGTPYIRFSCDSKAQIPTIQRTAELLLARGIRPYRLFIYLLVTQDIADAEYRVQELKKLKGITIYAQAEYPLDGSEPNAAQKRFAAKYIFGRSYKTENWEHYCDRHGLIPYAPDLGQGRVL